MKKIEKLPDTKKQYIGYSSRKLIYQDIPDVYAIKINEIIDKVNELDTIGKSDTKGIEHDS